MVPRVTLAAALAAFLSIGCSGPADGPMDAPTAISDARAAMGMENLTSLRLSGTASTLSNFMQSRSSAEPALVDVENYVRAIDLTQPASRATGEMMVVGLFGGDPQPQNYNQVANADSGWAQQLELWLTPWAFLEGAAENGAEARAEGGMTILTWMTPETVTAPSGLRYTVEGRLDAEGLVGRVRTWVPNNVAGDMPVEAVYSGYREIDGVMVPSTVEQTQAGVVSFRADLTDAVVNPADIAALISPPDAGGGGGRGGRGGAGGGRGGGGRGGGGRGAPAADAEPVELAEQLAEGVWRITGGYESLVVEFTDDVVVFEAGQSIARTEQVLDEVARILPDKPIRFVVNSHPHSDHAAGLPAVVARNIPIVTHENNVGFLTRALSNPRTLLGDDDPLKQAGTAPDIRGVAGDPEVIEDDTMRLELHHIQDLGHTDGMLVAYLPESRILFQADFTLPGPDAAPNDFVVTLGENVERLGLDFERYYGVHASAEPLTRADFDAALARRE